MEYPPDKTYIVFNLTYENIKIGRSYQPEARLKDFKSLFKEEEFALLYIWLGNYEVELQRMFKENRLTVSKLTGWYPDYLLSREIFALTQEMWKFFNEVSWTRCKVKLPIRF